MSVGRICIREVDTAEPDESIQVAAGRMRQRGVGALVILDSAGRPAGIVTDRDLVERVLAEGVDPARTFVSQVMQKDPETVSEETPLESVLALMKAGAFRRVPVVNDAGTLVGLVSLDDILMLLAEEFTLIGQLLERETPREVANRLTRQW